MATTRSKTILHLDPRSLRALNLISEKTGRPADEILEDALSLYVAIRFPDIEPDSTRPDLVDLLHRLRGTHPDEPSDEEAQRIAYEELHAMRRERRDR